MFLLMGDLISMLVKIFTLKNGLDVINEANAIRIKSREYNLLILKDYAAIMGKIEGSLEIETNNEVKKFDSINGYYVCLDNVFNLMIEGE